MMKVIVAILVTAALCAGTGLYAHDGGGHGGGYHGGGHHGGCDGAYEDGSGSGGGGSAPTGPYPLLVLRMIPGRELASTPASARWLCVEPISEEVIKQQQARDRNFAAAVADWEARNGRKISEE